MGSIFLAPEAGTDEWTLSVVWVVEPLMSFGPSCSGTCCVMGLESKVPSPGSRVGDLVDENIVE